MKRKTHLVCIRLCSEIVWLIFNILGVLKPKIIVPKYKSFQKSSQIKDNQTVYYCIIYAPKCRNKKINLTFANQKLVIKESVINKRMKFWSTDIY